MIAQLLHRDFVLDQAEELQEVLDSVRPEDLPPPEAERRGTPTEVEDIIAEELRAEAPLTDEDLSEARGLLEQALQDERIEPSGQVGFPPPDAERRGEEVAPLDDFAFVSRNATLSNLQSALELQFELDVGLGTEGPEDDRRFASEEPSVTDRYLPEVPPKRDLFDGRRLFDRFSVTDYRWTACLFAMGIRRSRARHPFNPEPAGPMRVGNRVRLVLVGDWGTGIPRARKVARQIREVLDRGRQETLEQHLVHLGDVYYSGWRYEYQQRFLRWWPVNEGEEIGSWILNGNHDMYSGGHAYFNVALRDPRFQGQHDLNGLPTSLFSLENDHWTILGLDTAWENHGLQSPQGKWARELLRASGRKGILLSHHQIMSACEPVAPKNPLRLKISPALATGQVRAWFWGHEHRAVAYAPIPGVDAPRCLGHGGVPVYSAAPGTPFAPGVVWEHSECFVRNRERWARFGFAVLDFDGPQIEVTYLDETGKEAYRESLE